MNKLKAKKVPVPKINRHFVFIEAPLSWVAPQLMLWGEADWWPKKSLLKITKLESEEIKVGTQYQIRAKWFRGPVWIVQVTKLVPSSLMERTFLSGMFEGFESVTIEERANGTRVDYEMRYTIKGILNKIFWRFIFNKLYDKNMKMILSALNQYVCKEYQVQYRKEEDGK